MRVEYRPNPRLLWRDDDVEWYYTIQYKPVGWGESVWREFFGVREFKWYWQAWWWCFKMNRHERKVYG